VAAVLVLSFAISMLVILAIVTNPPATAFRTIPSWVAIASTAVPLAMAAVVLLGLLHALPTAVEGERAHGTVIPRESRGNDALQNPVDREDDLAPERSMAPLPQQELEGTHLSLQHSPEVDPVHEHRDRPDMTQSG
jgi:hypothetical protein